MVTLVEKERRLHEFLRNCGSVAIGFSGGVDSTYLLRAACDALGAANVVAVIADTPSLPRRELADALKLADGMGVECVIVAPTELDDPAYVANPADRCYFCKKHLFTDVGRVARERGVAVALDGNNADDAGDFRPGRRAAQELGIKSPLLEVGLTKAEIRELSAKAGLPTADKPAMACLASRIPYGSPVTAAILSEVERAEQVLQDAGFDKCRVRHHGEVARIEVPVADLARMVEEQTRVLVIEGVRAAGFKFVALELQGYRMGSFN